MKLRSCLIVVPFLLAVIVAAVPPEPAKWASLGGDYQRSGRSLDPGPTGGCIQWQFEADAAIVGSLTVGSDGRVHVPCEDGKLYTLDAGGKVLWVFDANTPLWSAASIGPDGSLYVGGENGTLYAVDPNGTVAMDLRHERSHLLFARGCCQWRCLRRGRVTGRSMPWRSDGAELWRFTTKGPGKLPAGSILASPAIGRDGTVYIGGMYDPNLYALIRRMGASSGRAASSRQGEVAAGRSPRPWSARTARSTRHCSTTAICTPSSRTTGTILWATDLLDLAAFGMSSKDLDPDAAGWSEPVLGPDGTIYVSLDDPYLRAVRPDGKILWVSRLGELGGFTLTVDKNNLIYAACEDGNIYVVDSSGKNVTQFELGGWPAFPVVAGEGLLIATDSRDYSGYEAGGKNKVWVISSQCAEGSQPVSR